MPRTPRSSSEIELVKQEILDAALQFIVEDGFHNLSMRKLASRLGMTATTIYNYFANKDEINLMLRMRGFELLYQRLQKCAQQHADPVQKLRAMIRTYFEFGIGYAYYYDLMFNLHTPKYLDYVGTELEGVARTEKEASLRTYTLTTQVLTEILDGRTALDGREIDYLAIQLWCEVHGTISLHNSKLFREINADPAALIGTLIEDVVARFMGIGNRSRAES